jgi:hypothetical protein
MRRRNGAQTQLLYPANVGHPVLGLWPRQRFRQPGFQPFDEIVIRHFRSTFKKYYWLPDILCIRLQINP